MLEALPGGVAECRAAGPLDRRAGFVGGGSPGAPQPQALLDTDLRLTLDYRRGWLWPASRSFGEGDAEARNGDRAPVIPATVARTAPISRALDARASGPARPVARPAKLLVAALVAAQAALYQETCGRPCVLLVDDLPAELDGRTARVSSSVWPRPRAGVRHRDRGGGPRRDAAGRCAPAAGSRPARW